MQLAQIEFSEELAAFIDEWKTKPGSLIMMLHRIQEEFSYIPREAAEKLSRTIGLPLAKIYGVITFYHYFKTKKPGKHNSPSALAPRATSRAPRISSTRPGRSSI